MASGAEEQVFGRLRMLPVYSAGSPPECVQGTDCGHDKLLSDLKLARHDAVMAESAMRAHLVNHSLATVPVAGFGALIEDSARAAARYSQALHNLSRLASRAKVLGVLL